MKNEYFAHIRKSDEVIQSVLTHLLETAQIARILATKLDLAEAGELLGLMHDFGKYSEKFQKYIRRVTGMLNQADLDSEDETNGGDHSTAGAQWIYRRLIKYGSNGIGELCGQILGLCIASHHGAGLIDCLSPEGRAVWRDRFNKDDKDAHLSECAQKADKSILERAEQLASESLIQSLRKPIAAILSQQDVPFKIKELYLACLTRFLFSCLIDADRINSADFEREAQKEIRRFNEKPNWQQAIEALENHLSRFEIKYPIDQIRRNISKDCLTRAGDKQGIYSLTVPTGGGKTLATLRYALHHAQTHQLDRIIYIIPYTSIIDQNAQNVREILGDDWVLEHHSNIEPEKQTWQNKVLSENWDKPIIFTTMVQFLDAWFSGGTRGVRHIHAMTRSVLIFDEIQTLPIKCVHLFSNVLNWLAQFGKSTAVLCTATQPLLNQLKKPELGQVKLAENAELMGNQQNLTALFDDLSRVEIHYRSQAGGFSLENAGEFLLEQFKLHSSCLFIVNTKKWAQDLYRYCQEHHIPQDALFHLSTNQCSAHRKVIFEQIKDRLQNKEPVICISTQLIEAGVDISMACVIRALGGLDSIAQAAGRCNRHGEKEGKGQVYVLNLKEPNLEEVLPDITIGQDKAVRVFGEYEGKDILQPAAMTQYFKYYFHDRSDEMVYPLKNSTSGSLLDWLSDNCHNVYTPKNDRRTQPFPLLMQSFKSAGREFQVIDAPTQAVIVPYGEGKEIITTLCSVEDNKKKYEALAKAQRYSVNVFPNVWRKLAEAEALQETQAGSGIYYLDERHYLDEYGLCTDRAGNMTCYDF
ncbi:CRISPR-associated helicase Cas3 [Mannheimia varigena USDA-ARS-USMARC-1388]|uniref:CRISPR-associated helicase/endonuclease Cas3 n=1 Tax=Mannheimia varigena TaxID=85404 RepID=UPI0003E3E233|nr:CRISPR-associated helicase/endonuclease Cas3 [Mannheimia varigena]AHG79310.1 CRISPR-associated helicase Cas3 [Mannheimia varigena USDA-ARS-USMARC-1388]